ncbi:MAG: DUF2167 domain-containing protein [Desulfobulbaceae bacterium]|nr:DUF2167 domain-containing protein [Desulfobulbaceae bacterium]
MKGWIAFAASVVFVLSCSFLVNAADDGAEGMTVEAFLASLNFQSGKITIADDLVTLNLPDGFRYLSPKDAERVLVDAWGNPPGAENLGMIVPVSPGLFDDNGWAAIISYEEDGYVSDEEAEDIDYEKMKKELREASKEDNKERMESGYEPIEFVGWASTPYYDKPSHKLYWAKELKFGDAEVNSLNYNIRILGRKGVLLLNIVSTMPQLGVINTQIPNLLSMTEFNPGSRYTDFDPKLDKVAAYGLGALVAGTVASKVGLLAKIGTFLLAFKKLLIVIPVAIAGFFKKIFSKN